VLCPTISYYYSAVDLNLALCNWYQVDKIKVARDS